MSIGTKSSNRFYTILFIPEKTSQVRKVVLPAWLFKGSLLGFAFLSLVAAVMVFDYWYVMSQIGENKQLKMENRRLRQQVQVFRNKITTIESTMERVKTFTTRLKVITNIEDRTGLLQSLNQKLPDAATNVGQAAAAARPTGGPASDSATAPASGEVASLGAPGAGDTAANGATPGVALAVADSRDPEELQLRREFDELDQRFSDLNQGTLYVEQMLQDQYELLADQKAFLSALPTRKPSVGYFTSGFGVRKSPFGGRTKMHEGLDIANRPGTPIKAPADGVVLFAESKAGYGQTIILDHGYGLETWYGHTKKILVQRGQHIRRGDQIALLGNSGRSTGPHVHYEVRVHGTPVDPLSYILEN